MGGSKFKSQWGEKLTYQKKIIIITIIEPNQTMILVYYLNLSPEIQCLLQNSYLVWWKRKENKREKMKSRKPRACLTTFSKIDLKKQFLRIVCKNNFQLFSKKNLFRNWNMKICFLNLFPMEILYTYIQFKSSQIILHIFNNFQLFSEEIMFRNSNMKNSFLNLFSVEILYTCIHFKSSHIILYIFNCYSKHSIKKPLKTPQMCSRKQLIFRTNFQKTFFRQKFVKHIFKVRKLFFVLKNKNMFLRTVAKQVLRN